VVFEWNGYLPRRLGQIAYERIENRGSIGGTQMVESDHDVALEDTDRIQGRTALVNIV